MTSTLTFTRHSQSEDVEPLLVDIYAQVYADRLDDPFFSTSRFTSRLHQHAAGNQWEAVIGYDGTTPVGYAYGASRPGGTAYWSTVTPAPAAEFSVEDGRRTFVLFEFMILPRWRGTGTSRAVHNHLLDGRTEQRVTLAVEHSHPKVRTRYEAWGYRLVGQRTPAPDSPVMDIMWRPRVL